MNILQKYIDQTLVIEELKTALKKANIRERSAFKAGWNCLANDVVKEFGDIEQAWSHYRCQDDSD